jgi:hypothetical protein
VPRPQWLTLSRPLKPATIPSARQDAARKTPACELLRKGGEELPLQQRKLRATGENRILCRRAGARDKTQCRSSGGAGFASGGTVVDTGGACEGRNVIINQPPDNISNAHVVSAAGLNGKVTRVSMSSLSDHERRRLRVSNSGVPK